MKTIMKYKYFWLMLAMITGITLPAKAQSGGVTVHFIVQGQVISAQDGLEIVGAHVSEIDATNRLVGSTATDFNGKYVLKVKNPTNRIEFSYIGYKKKIEKIDNRRTINVKLDESTIMIKTVEVMPPKKATQGGFTIPTKEISTAIQTISTKEFEGLQVSTIDEALQGRIAGLDIVANSGDPGSGTSMRIRGVSSINSNNEPLIVVNGVPYEVQIDPNFDFASANQEQFANMLSINPDDILEISVLKDAGAASIWGSKGANGVLMITTKRGLSGPTRIDYTYRYTRTKQPKGMNMLTGDDFSMLMKQAYLNPKQDDAATDIDEYNYDTNFPQYENFNNNTDWVKEVTQIGNINDHYLTISGGGERARYRVSGGFYKQNGTVIGQSMERFSSRAYLEYSVSDRIKFTTEISLTNSDNYRNYENLLGIAYRKMPNVSVYRQDADGNNTGIFYNISRSSTLDDDQKYLKNPVALAALATSRLQSFRILPTFRLQYDFLDPLAAKASILRYSMYVSFDINNSKTSMFLPQEVSNLAWNNNSVNRAESNDRESMNIYSEQNLLWNPKFENKDHDVTLYGALQITAGNSASQSNVTYSLPSGKAIDASVFGYLAGAGTGHGSWRSMALLFRGHYAYKGRYVLDATYRRDGSTKFGPGNKFGDFPSLSMKWLIADEPFMEKTKEWLSTLSFRTSWGISGNDPNYEYLHYSRYGTYGSYIDMTAVRPVSLRLSNLKWETSEGYNYGVDLGFKDDMFLFDINFYNRRTSDMLFPNVALSQISGYSSLSYINGGIMDNNGWEITLYANRFIKVKDFSVDFRLNFANNYNKLIYLEQSLLDSYNGEYDYNNGTYLTRVQKGNSFGSIYGFKYKGVYQYDEYVAGEHENAPVARDAENNVITDQDGNPRSLWFNYYGKGGRTPYKFRGGDAIYEDVNHDGSIDELDIVYLGNSNPLLNGGFGPTFRYKNISCNMFFNFRYGNKIVNAARMNAENMYYDNNQSKSVNWRWRKDGDITTIPRALHEAGYNWLGSDRFVEDGSFMRLKYLTFNYTLPQDIVKKVKLSKVNFYLTFNNVFVWTKYSGVDPEVGYGSLGVSKDNSQTPRSNDVTFGASIGL
jgi:TonB-linked SusC/RagA family outer membrane protein